MDECSFIPRVYASAAPLEGVSGRGYPIDYATSRFFWKLSGFKKIGCLNSLVIQPEPVAHPLFGPNQACNCSFMLFVSTERVHCKNVDARLDPSCFGMCCFEIFCMDLIHDKIGNLSIFKAFTWMIKFRKNLVMQL